MYNNETYYDLFSSEPLAESNASYYILKVACKMFGLECFG